MAAERNEGVSRTVSRELIIFVAPGLGVFRVSWFLGLPALFINVRYAVRVGIEGGLCFDVPVTAVPGHEYRGGQEGREQGSR